ncbi:MAG: 1-acyl-sn-glycerol-3-phosphate acyltransferase [Candidatus Omnitrophica bacterium]|nr:1-acyl-sn-glycerol-3-phosphate acyltransferase [Candidatus Omnitrophota bacterium]
MKYFYLQVMSLWVWVVIAVLTVLDVLAIIILCPLYIFDKKRAIAHWLGSVWGRGILFINPLWDITVTGRENIQKNKSYIIVANHQSMGDIIVLYYLRTNFKWIAKSSLFKVPFLGWGMSLAGYIPLKRGQHGSIRESFQEAINWIKRGVSVLFFPEGTRSLDAKLAPFKNGAFKLAAATKTPVLPVVITGTSDALEKGSWVFSHRVHAAISILPPINVSVEDETNFAHLRELAHAAIQAELERLKNTIST